MSAVGSTNERTNGTEKPRRVLFVDSQVELSGTGFAMLPMLEHMDRSQISPLYLSLAGVRPEIYPRIESLGIPAFHIPAGRFRQVGRATRAVLGIRKLIKREGIDLVLANSGHPLLFVRPAAVATGRPCVCWIHGYVPGNGSWREPIAVAQRVLGADALFSNSEFTARMLRQDFADHPDISVVRPGVDLGKFCPAPQAGADRRQELGVSPGEHLIGLFGRLQRWKGQDVFLRAAARIRARGLACRFLLVGSSQFGIELPYADQLRRQVEEDGLGACVKFLGQRSDVNELMNACDVVVHASVEPEPWGLVVAEAMAAGRPVIASAAGGPLEMIEDGTSGLLTPPGDVKALAAAMESLLAASDTQARLGTAARRRAEEIADARVAAERLCSELLRVHAAYFAPSPARVRSTADEPVSR
jgi:glycosyltransferase involved in cell wall biosynthesis